MVGILFLDFRKAFDLVAHAALKQNFLCINLAHLLTVGLLLTCTFVVARKQSKVVKDYQNSSMYVRESPKAQS